MTPALPAEAEGCGGSLAQWLGAAGACIDGLLVHRITLHPGDRSDDFPDLDAVERVGAIETYARMQNGRRFGAEAAVILGRARPGGLIELIGGRQLRARPRGIAPGDIVYDYDAAALLHGFISRARYPVFYDCFPLEDFPDVRGLLLYWPKPAFRATLPACHAGLRLV